MLGQDITIYRARNRNEEKCLHISQVDLEELEEVGVLRLYKGKMERFGLHHRRRAWTVNVQIQIFRSLSSRSTFRVGESPEPRDLSTAHSRLIIGEEPSRSMARLAIPKIGKCCNNATKIAIYQKWTTDPLLSNPKCSTR